MKQINFDFFNNDIVRVNSNCYTYALGSHWGFFSAPEGMMPGTYRAKTGYRPPQDVNDLKARIIIDGAVPVEDPHRRRNRAGFSLPVPPAGHYLVMALAGRFMKRWIPHFVKIEGMADDKVVEFSLRDGACVPGHEWAGEAWPDKMPIETFRTKHSNQAFSYDFVGFFACPNAGIDLSVQKVVRDIHASRPEALNGLDKGFVDANLEFFNTTDGLRSVDFNDSDLADLAVSEYYSAFEKYVACWDCGETEAINAAITDAYQRTPLAAADSQRVYELFAKNLSAREQRIMRNNKSY